MNERQYNIMKRLLKMGIKPKRLANELDVDLMTVIRVETTDNFPQFQDSGSNPDNSSAFDEFMKMFGGK